MNDLMTSTESRVLADVAAQISTALARRLRRSDIAPLLEEAISYSLLSGGKRLRPALVLLCAEAAGADRAVALGPACALELIHTFSLVHDDLPAMDDDALRRGRPTLHVQAGEATAVLAGDAMLSMAFHWATDVSVPAGAVVRIVRELAAATTDMISGQVYDTIGGLPAELTDEQRLQIIQRTKTGALLRAACRMGAICAEADPLAEQHLVEYGEALGEMFQIVDDLLDVTQTAEHVGKATGKDLDAGKLTSPGVIGIERSREAVERLRRRAHEALAPLGAEADPLRSLCDEMAVRTR
jgi:geranylgeranyl diphosphate synthase type II